MHYMLINMNRKIFIFGVLFSGSMIPTLQLLSSNIFGLKYFDMGLTDNEISKLNSMHILTHVFTGNIPQLIIQILYSIEIKQITNNTSLSFIASILVILGTIFTYFFYKQFDKKRYLNKIEYYLEIKYINNQKLIIKKV